MKTKHWIAAAAGIAAALALFAGNAQATDDETSYRFRLVNNDRQATHIRCGSSGSWTTVGLGGSTDISCSQPSAQTKLGGGNALNRTHDCSADRPIKRVRYSGYYIGMRWKGGIYVTCLAS